VPARSDGTPSAAVRGRYEVVSVEPVAVPDGGQGTDWCRYVLVSGSSRITGLHRAPSTKSRRSRPAPPTLQPPQCTWQGQGRRRLRAEATTNSRGTLSATVGTPGYSARYPLHSGESAFAGRPVSGGGARVVDPRAAKMRAPERPDARKPMTPVTPTRPARWRRACAASSSTRRPNA